ncbi:hypothetical protein [Ekhidna sp.]
MKKNIAIFILLVLTVVSFIYASIKADEAEKAAVAAIVAQAQAEKEKERADHQARIALDNAADARSVQAELEQCKAK